MLTPEFESGKPTGAQSMPKLVFFLCLLASKPTRIGSWVHQCDSRSLVTERKTVNGLLSPALSSIGGEGPSGHPPSPSPPEEERVGEKRPFKSLTAYTTDKTSSPH